MPKTDHTTIARWTGPEVAKIVKISYDTLDYWVKKGLIKPSYPASQPKYRSYYSFSDIVTVAALNSLRQQGISLQKLRKAKTEVWTRIGMSLGQGLRGGVIVADQKELFAVLYTFDDAIQIMSLLKGGQLVLPLDEIIAEVRQRTEHMFGEVSISNLFNSTRQEARSEQYTSDNLP